MNLTSGILKSKQLTQHRANRSSTEGLREVAKKIKHKEGKGTKKNYFIRIDG